MEMILTKIQQKALDAIHDGQSIFLTGEAGTGKSKVIQTFWERCKHKDRVGLTSTTGASALILGGSTLHSYLGIGLGVGNVENLVTKIAAKSYLLKRWNRLQTLIIDEISMLSPDLFDKLNEVAKRLKYGSKTNGFRLSLLNKDEKHRPWGGIQLIISGDFCQLPVVKDTRYTFEANTWKESIDHTFYLTENMRQSNNPTFQTLLSNVRLGNISKETVDLLNSRVGATWGDTKIRPTLLCALNRQVNSINDNELDNIAEKNEDATFIEYDMKISKLERVPDWLVRKYKKDSIVPESIQLTQGVQVMLLKNIYEGQGESRNLLLGNGSLGIVTKIDQETQYPHVTFGCMTLLIEPHDFEIRSVPTCSQKEGVVEVVISQLPLKLAYAISIHKSQGLTLERAEVDLSGCFCTGHAYVALSRVRSLEGLKLTEPVKKNWIRADEKCIRYYSNLEKDEALRKPEAEAIRKKQESLTLGGMQVIRRPPIIKPVPPISTFRVGRIAR